ncbi:hypothetical protein [Campylobacter devanensis]|uniref:hypothetical protein n=1 Tax=Campylobacter devanensis TaxID=3161138 RepID=UPI000A358CEE|nr:MULTISPECIES: hypothetical protein [unclassified Campylobacter]
MANKYPFDDFFRDLKKEVREAGFKPKIFWMIAPFAIFILLTILVKYGVVHKNIIPYTLTPMFFIPLFFHIPVWIFKKIDGIWDDIIDDLEDRYEKEFNENIRITRKVKKWLGEDKIEAIYTIAMVSGIFILLFWITMICVGLVKLGKGIF